ncbi:hypothetical protein CSUI_007747 [Cystoisospora suis]|uniref:Uncharacterized protein n=1 Tax=Cystoisospora suis TaxID=483139 RepID=A0A2C6KPY8_9APIC|nr:hypothetical protein CSUI_007747 [Cystoisospora suis]
MQLTQLGESPVTETGGGTAVDVSAVENVSSMGSMEGTLRPEGPFVSGPSVIVGSPPSSVATTPGFPEALASPEVRLTGLGAPSGLRESPLSPVGSTSSDFESSDGGDGNTGDTTSSLGDGVAWKLLSELKLAEARDERLRTELRFTSSRWKDEESYIATTWRSRQSMRKRKHVRQRHLTMALLQTDFGLAGEGVWVAEATPSARPNDLDSRGSTAHINWSPCGGDSCERSRQYSLR